MSSRARLAWFAAVVFVAVFGAGELIRWTLESVTGPSWWAIDFELVVDAGERLVLGLPLYSDPRFLYPPFAALVGAPLSLVDPLPASLAYAAVKAGLVAACTAGLTPGWTLRDRIMAIVGVVGCLPFLHDLFLGNSNTIIVAAMVPAVFGPSRPRSGVLLGLVAAAFAKPLIVPVLLWLLVWRRPAFVGVIVTGLAATALAVLIAGAGSHVEWVQALAAGTRYAVAFAGNHGVTALAPELFVPIAAITALGLLFVLLRRGPRAGLAWACASGILLAPYAGTYAALPIVLALPAIGPLAPAFAFAILAASPVATTHPLTFFAAAVMLGVLLLREPRVNGRWEPLSRRGSGAA
jgi:alpha-1,2-mannosyltransferase